MERTKSQEKTKLSLRLANWLNPKESASPTLRWAVGFALVGITVWGFLLRIYDGGVQSLWVDEGTSLTAALGILENGTPHLASGESYWRAPLNTYLIGAAIWLGAVDEFTARLPAMLFGTASIIMVFLLGRRLGGTWVGVASAALIAFADIEIAWSRQVRMYQQLQFFSLFVAYAYLNALQVSSRRWVFATGVAVAGVATSHVLGFLVVMVLGLHFFSVHLSRVRRFQDLRAFLEPKYLLILILGAGIVLLSELAESAVSRSLGRSSNFLNEYLDYLLTQYMLVFSLGSVGLVIRMRYRTREIFFVLLIVCVSLYVLSFHGPFSFFRYIYFLLPFFFIGFVLALSMLPRLLGLARFEWFGPTLVSVGVVMAIAGGGFTVVPKTYYYLENNSPQPDFKAAYTVVSAQMQPNDIVIDAWPALGRFYLQRPPDYWPVFNTGALPKNNCLVDGGQREIYGNATCLASASALQEVVEHSARGWVILDGLAWRQLPSATRSYLADQLMPVPVVSQANSPFQVRVFRWEQE